MKVAIPAGSYILAVSGGIDSMTLLDILHQKPGINLALAHFNHGIRSDAKKDEEFVGSAAQKFGLPYEVGHGHLGARTSEDRARAARYKFLNQVKQKHQANAIITAHHEDDLIETAIINIMRGSGRRGLSAIAENPDIMRPLLGVSKKDILAYAKVHHLKWREDPTNRDERYLRNYIRRQIVPKLSHQRRQQFLKALRQTAITNQLINQEIAKLSQKLVRGRVIQRAAFISLPTEIANEVLTHFLRSHGIKQFDKPIIGHLSMAIKTAKGGTKHDVVKGATIEITASEALLR